MALLSILCHLLRLLKIFKPCQTFMMKLFYENNWRLRAVNCFRENFPYRCLTGSEIQFWSNLMKIMLGNNPAGNYMFKVNNRNARARSEICSKLTIKTPKRHQWRCSGVFNVNFEHISHLALVFLLLTLSR